MRLLGQRGWNYINPQSTKHFGKEDWSRQVGGTANSRRRAKMVAKARSSTNMFTVPNRLRDEFDAFLKAQQMEALE